MSHPTIHRQIEWANQKVKSMQRRLPEVVANNRMTAERADEELALAQAVLKTLMTLREIVRGEDTPR